MILPALGGVRTCQQLKEDPILARTVVVAITDSSDLRYIEQAFRAGAEFFLKKPFGAEGLVQVVKDAVHRAQVRGRRRTHSRFPVELPVRCVVEEMEGTAVNASLSGLKLHLAEKLAPGAAEEVGSSWSARTKVVVCGRWSARWLRWEGREERDMFGKGHGATITYLGKGIRIIGDVYGTDTLVCEGEIRGTVEVDGLVQIAPAGKVEGHLRAREAEIAGVVRGDIATRERLKLQASCRVQGNVVTPKLVIEPGALLDGQVCMLTGDAQATPEAPISTLPAASLPL